VAANVNVTVETSAVQFSDEGEDKKFGLWFSFDANKPAHIVWDPTVSTNNYSLSTTVVANILLLASILLFAL